MKQGKTSGQTLIEVLAAVAVAAVIIVGVTLLAFSGLRNVKQARNQSQAARYVQEGLEQVRAVRDQQSWTDFAAYAPGNYYDVVKTTSPWSLQLLTNPNTKVPIPSTIFEREIYLDDSSVGVDDGRKVTVIVYWVDPQGNNLSSSSTILTKWR